jgi:anti-sigma factor RsiW
MKCHSIGEKLSAYIENHLSSEERVQREEHLGTCRHCRASLEDLKKTMEFTREIEEVEPPPWLTQKVMNKIREERQKKGILQRLFSPLHIKVPLEAAAMIAIVVVAVYVYKNLQPEGMLKEKPADPVLSQEEEQRGEREDQLFIFKEEQPAAPEPVKKQVSEQEAGIVSGEIAPPAEKDDVAAPQRAPGVSYRGMDSEMMEKKSKSVPEEETAYVKEKKETAFFTIHVEDTERALKDLDKIFKAFDMRYVDKESLEGKDIIAAEVESQYLNDLNEKLKTIGRIEEKKEMLQHPVGKVQVRIEIVRKPD